MNKSIKDFFDTPNEMHHRLPDAAPKPLDPVTADLPARILGRIEARGIAIEELAQRIGMSPRKLTSRLENPARFAFMDVYRIARALDVDVRVFV